MTSNRVTSGLNRKFSFTPSLIWHLRKLRVMSGPWRSMISMTTTKSLPLSSSHLELVFIILTSYMLKMWTSKIRWCRHHSTNATDHYCDGGIRFRSEEHTSELQSRFDL